MTIKNTYAAESWDKVYSAFQQINFTSYDYDTVKESLLQYLKIYYPEHFNDFIESSELVAVLELFAYVAELLAYRVDVVSHENFMTTAQRKQSILKLAKLVSYTASRNIPARGLVKIQTVKTTETVYDSLGNNLAGSIITWNDPNNTNWKEQFFLVMNLILTTPFGQPSKSFQIADVTMQLYTFNNNTNALNNGVYPFSATSTGQTFAMEAVPIDIDANGPFERSPDPNAQFNLVYASDGKGDGSDYTGFLLFVKQGTLVRTDYTIGTAVANRRIELDATNVNDTDVWVYRVDSSNTIIENWTQVQTISEQNLAFNTAGSRQIYEVETLENDGIALLFGDGNFSDAPIGNFQLWTRISLNQSLNIPKNAITGQPMAFSYVNATNASQQFSLTFSLTSAIQNNSASETTEHIRQAAPSTYYAQNRMVNGQDYNTFPLKDPTILRLTTINRTFAGQPKYLNWNDASQTYENTKMFGDDLKMFLDVSAAMNETTASAKTIIDSSIEPLLQTNALLNVMTHILATSPDAAGIISYPRRSFIEDNRPIYYDVDGNFVNPYGREIDGNPLQTADGSLNEKTMIQGALDQHWYGDPLSYATINGTQYGVINDPILNPQDDGKLYISDLPRTIDGVNPYPPGDIGSGLQAISPQQFFGLRFNRFLSAFGNGALTISTTTPVVGLSYYKQKAETFTIEMTSDLTTFTVISNLRGSMPNYSLALSSSWESQAGIATPFDFSIAQGTVAFAAGDAFVVDVTFNSAANEWSAALRTFGTINAPRVNLNGWWELVPRSVITGDTSLGGANIFSASNPTPSLTDQMTFMPDTYAYSWAFLVAANEQSGVITSWDIYYRDMKIIVESDTTNFWVTQDTQIIDPQTLKPLYDKIRILRSNLDETGAPLLAAQIYDVVDFVYDQNGVKNFNQLEVLPTDTINFTQAGDSTPDDVLQFETFASNSYQYGYVDTSSGTAVITWLTCGSTGSQYQVVSYDTAPIDSTTYDFYGIKFNGNEYAFPIGSFVGVLKGSGGSSAPAVVRRLMVPAPVSSTTDNNDINGCNIITGLDFMWQHFSPLTNLIDPSVSNIHDAFVLTSGYYSSMMDYVNGISSILPQPPTPLDLRTSYGYLLENKMLSDTVVLHSGSIKLLFGALADPQFRAKFRVVKKPSATFSDERIKTEIISVINTYFDIQNWDFGDTFYATELITLIHQRMPTQIASVVLVPTFSVNSFGSLFTIDSGFDEVLQSAATVNDVEIVSALTPSVLRQIA